MADGRRRCLGHLLLAALLPRRSGRLPRAPRTSLPLSLTLPRSHPLPWISPSLTRESPPTSLATTAATATSSLPLRSPELRPDPVELHTRRTRPREASNVAIAVVFHLGLRPPSSSIRRTQDVPESFFVPVSVPSGKCHAMNTGVLLACYSPVHRSPASPVLQPGFTR